MACNLTESCCPHYATHAQCDHPLTPYVNALLAQCNTPPPCAGYATANTPIDENSAGYGPTDAILFNLLCALFLLFLSVAEYRLETLSPPSKTEPKQTGSQKSTQLLAL